MTANAPPAPFVNIGMVTYNRLAFTRQAIEALLLNTDYPYVLTVVDNGSTDGTREFLQQQLERGPVRHLILLDENIGVARASNIAWLMEPQAGCYLKMDNDVVIRKPFWLHNLVRLLDSHPRLGAAACNFEPVSYPLRGSGSNRFRLKRKGNLGGACILIPRRTCERLGFWSEEYGLYGEEDGDYGARIHSARMQNAYLADEETGFHLPAGRAAVIDNASFEARDGHEEVTHENYRSWKDDLRRRNWESGLFPGNLKGYAQGSKSLFVVPDFALEFIGKRYPEKIAAWSSIGWYANGCLNLAGVRIRYFVRHPSLIRPLRRLSRRFFENPMVVSS